MVSTLVRAASFCWQAVSALAGSAGGWGQLPGWKGKDDEGYKKMRGLAEASLKPLPFRDADGTCGDPAHCRCGSCWVKPFETEYRKKNLLQ